MQQTPFSTLRKTALLPTLIAMGLLAGCSGGGDSAANAAAPVDGDAVEARVQASAAAAAAAPADFEGTMQQVVISLGSDAVRKVVGSTDLETVLAFSPDRLIEAVRSEEHTSELQSLMRISYAVFCLKKKISDNQLT